MSGTQVGGSGGVISKVTTAGLPLGLTGATASTRYVGGTAGGAPASGTFAVGDFVIDQTGAAWVCTVAGSPGTWVELGSLLTSLTVTTGAVVITDGSVKEYRFRTSGSNLDVEGAGADLFLSVWSGFNFTGSQRNYFRLEAGAQIMHAIGPIQVVTGPFAGAAITLDPATGTNGQATIGQVVCATGNSISQGTGAPSKPNGVNPTAGDIWFRTDTPSTANQRIYICTTGGGTPVWAALAV